jgi:RecG-like helicase
VTCRQRDRASEVDNDDPVATRIADVALRRRCEVSAAITSLESTGRPTVMLDVVVDDGTARLVCTFFGRLDIPGFHVGRRVHVSGRLVRYRDRLCLLNPAYELMDEGCASPATSS